MELDRFFESYLEKHKAGTAGSICEDDYVLSGCIQLYKVTKDMFFKEFVSTYMKDLIDNHGKIKGYKKEKFQTDNLFIGSILLWLFGETKEDKYRIAAQMLREQLYEHPRTSSGNFIHSVETPDTFNMEDLYHVEPFYMQYETEFESKECYLDIVAQFESARTYLSGSDLKSIGQYMMALIDTMDVMSPEIFEHYKILERTFKELTREVLARRDETAGMFLQDNTMQEQGSLMIGYAIMKACNLGVLLKEKYFDIGSGILNAFLEIRLLKKRQVKNCKFPEEDDICMVQEEAGLLMMAYSQYKMQNTTKKN